MTISPDSSTRVLEEVQLSTLDLDAEINRHADDNWVGRITSGFNPMALGLFIVWLLGDGRRVLLDGQHRKLAAGIVGYDDPVAAYIYSGLTMKSAAELFLAINAQRNVSAIDKFRKACQAERETEVAVAAMLASYDLTVGYGAADLTSPNEMVHAYTRLGEEQARAVIEMLTGAFAEVKRADALSGEIVAVTAKVLVRYAWKDTEVDLAHLGKVLAEVHLPGLMVERDVLRSGSPHKTKRFHLASAMVKLYNESATRSQRLTPWPDFNK